MPARYFFLTALYTILHCCLYAQNSNPWLSKPNIKPYGYLDIYFVATDKKPDPNYKQKIYSNYGTLYQFNVNQAVLGGKITSEKYRAVLAFHYGTYLDNAYIQEDSHLKYLRNAHIGIALNKKNTLWLDGGIFESPLTREATMPANNWSVTMPVISALSPFYQTGLRLQYLYKNHWEFTFWTLNGWGRITRLPGNTLPSFMFSTNYTHKKGALGYNFFLGTDFPDTTRRMRYFNDLSGSWNISDKFSLGFSLELGHQQSYKNSKDYQYWLSGELALRYKFLKYVFGTLRFEYFDDPNSIVLPDLHNNITGIKAAAVSYNMDYRPIENIALRAEVKYMHSQQPIFKIPQGFIQDRTTLTFSLSYLF